MGCMITEMLDHAWIPVCWLQQQPLTELSQQVDKNMTFYGSFSVKNYLFRYFSGYWLHQSNLWDSLVFLKEYKMLPLLHHRFLVCKILCFVSLPLLKYSSESALEKVRSSQFHGTHFPASVDVAGGAAQIFTWAGWTAFPLRKQDWKEILCW